MPCLVGMHSQQFSTLESFLYNLAYEDWWVKSVETMLSLMLEIVASFCLVWHIQVTNSMATIWPWWIQGCDAWILHAKIWCNVFPLWTFCIIMVAFVCFILWGLRLCSSAQFGWLTCTLFSSHCRRGNQFLYYLQARFCLEQGESWSHM